MPRTLNHLIGWSIVIALAATALAEPPRVVKATPDNGDTNVDPNLQELRVEFDQDMAQGGFSWCGGGEAFPKARAKPRWESARVCVFPVQLVPDHEYRLSINCPAAQSFRSAAGEPAVVYPIAFRTAAGAASVAKPLDPAVQKESVAALRRAVDRHYSYRDLRKVNWDKLFAEFTPQLEQAETGAAFARLAGELLAKAEDIHIWLECDGMNFASHRRSVPFNCSLERLAKLVPGYQRHNDCVATGRFPDGIGYIAIHSWGGGCTDALEPAYAAIGECGDCRGMIIDVRTNSGGDEGLAGQFAGCFVDKPVVYARHVFRDPAAAGGFTAPSERTLRPSKSRPKFRGKVAVLIGRHVMSSCEAFVLMMKQVPDCKIVGEPTYGASGNPKPRSLPNGVVVYLPSWKSITPTGQEFEGQGLKPDVEVPAKQADFADQDPVLDAALKYLRG